MKLKIIFDELETIEKEAARKENDIDYDKYLLCPYVVTQQEMYYQGIRKTCQQIRKHIQDNVELE